MVILTGRHLWPLQVGSVGIPEAETMRAIFPDAAQAAPPEFHQLPSGLLEVPHQHKWMPCFKCLRAFLGSKKVHVRKVRCFRNVCHMRRRCPMQHGKHTRTSPTATQGRASGIRSCCTARPAAWRTSVTWRRSRIMCSTSVLLPHGSSCQQQICNCHAKL